MLFIYLETKLPRSWQYMQWRMSQIYNWLVSDSSIKFRRICIKMQNEKVFKIRQNARLFL